MLTHACVLSCVQFFMTPWTVAHQAPLSMGFPMQQYFNGLPFSPPGNLPDQESNLCLLHAQAKSLPLSHQGSWAMSIRLHISQSDKIA